MSFSTALDGLPARSILRGKTVVQVLARAMQGSGLYINIAEHARGMWTSN